MKRYTVIILSLILVICALFSGCAESLGMGSDKLTVKIENGEANPTLKVMSKIANALGMNISLVPKQVQMLQIR